MVNIQVDCIKIKCVMREEEEGDGCYVMAVESIT